jgi:hypothetical protein
VTDPLFAYLPGPVGPLRAALDALVADQVTAGALLRPDLILVAESLADRIDSANAARAYRGLVLLTAEYRAATRDLFEAVPAADDGLDAALAEFRAAEAHHPAGPVPNN